MNTDKIPYSCRRNIAPHLRSYLVRTSSLRYPKSLKLLDESQLKTMATTLRRFQQQQPIIFDPKTREVTIGANRYYVIRRLLKWKYIAAIPCAITGLSRRSAQKKSMSSDVFDFLIEMQKMYTRPESFDICGAELTDIANDVKKLSDRFYG